MTPPGTWSKGQTNRLTEGSTPDKTEGSAPDETEGSTPDETNHSRGRSVDPRRRRVGLAYPAFAQDRRKDAMPEAGPVQQHLALLREDVEDVRAFSGSGIVGHVHCPSVVVMM